MIVFGPIPSRRLGQSIGINNIPPKSCPYSCVYCQIGRTTKMFVEPKEFYTTKEILLQVENKLNQLKKDSKSVDYLTFVPDGEPTLDKNLGKHIDRLSRFGINIAVITNASLLWNKEVRDNLLSADWVSVKIDSVDETLWRKIDRPHGNLNLDEILKGTIEFAGEFQNTLVTETMLVKEINDDMRSLKDTAQYIKKVNASKSYLLVPTRPPAESGVASPEEKTIRDAYDIYKSVLGADVECITGDEGNNFYFTNKIADELLSLTSVHPIKERVILEHIDTLGFDKSVIDNLLNKELIKRYKYKDEWFYRRNLQ